jgi:hypothetical protein
MNRCREPEGGTLAPSRSGAAKQKNAEAFQAHTMFNFFLHSLFLSGGEVESVRERMDQNSVFDFAEWIWKGHLRPTSFVATKPLIFVSRLINSLNKLRVVYKIVQCLAHPSDPHFGDATGSVASGK